MFHQRRTDLRSLILATAIGGAGVLVSGCTGPSAMTPAAAPNAIANPPPAAAEPAGWNFITLDNENDPTFNQLLGINNHGKIAGYFGSGAMGHPNKGYTLVAPYAQSDYTNENYPGSMQTQVTAINNIHDTAGFWVDAKNVNRGFIEWNGVFTSYRDPDTGKGTVNQILGLNDSGIAAGFYTDGKSVNHGFLLNQATGKFTPVTPPGATNVTVAGINANGDICGFYGPPSATIGFIRKGKHFSTFSFPNSQLTMALGINIHDQIVGTYTDSANAMHGFLLSDPLTHAKWKSIDNPHGVGTTTINGLNDKDDLVGFYVDSAGNTDGMLATP
jgi:hypothetical protein